MHYFISSEGHPGQLTELYTYYHVLRDKLQAEHMRTVSCCTPSFQAYRGYGGRMVYD